MTEQICPNCRNRDWIDMPWNQGHRHLCRSCGTAAPELAELLERLCEPTSNVQQNLRDRDSARALLARIRAAETGKEPG